MSGFAETAEIVRIALLEDKVQEDVTTNSLMQYDQDSTARIVAKETGLVSGIRAVKETFRQIDENTGVLFLKNDGERVYPGDVVAEIRGKESSILKGERTALNFLQRMSGIATLTSYFVAETDPFGVTLLDTRKTTPGLRSLEKKAVVDGGGSNHRSDLSEMAMIKDNHIRMAGSITRAVAAVRKQAPDVRIEVETQNLKQFREALAADVDVIMLDNFSAFQVREAVALNQNTVKLELSGNVTLENIRQKASLGVDFVSVGALTHSYKSLDLSLEFVES